MSAECQQLQAQLEELQIRVAFQEDTLNTLSEQMAHLQMQNEQLQRVLSLVLSQLKDLKTGEGDFMRDFPEQEKPPHY